MTQIGKNGDRSVRAIDRLVPRPAARSIEEVVGPVRRRTPMKTLDSKSGAGFERIDAESGTFVVKHLHVDDDWIQRCSGDLACRPLVMWRSGLFDALPPCIDPAVVGCVAGEGRDGWGAALVMPDVGADLVPEGDGPLPEEQQHRILDHLADLHASTWGWADTVGLLPPSNRWLEFHPSMGDAEEARGWPDPVPPLIIDGWRRLSEVAPSAARVIEPLQREPWPLLEALDDLPHSFLHGDTKLGNLGSRPDGRTIMLDWAMPGEGPPLAEITWYLAINSARLSHTKEDAIATYRSSLERRGVATADWFDRQLALCLLGAMVQFGWEKQYGGPGPELDWWVERALEGSEELGR